MLSIPLAFFFHQLCIIITICYLILQECQAGILSEFSAMEDIIQSLTKAADKPDMLMDDAESILLQLGCRDLSRTGSIKNSIYVPDHERASSLFAAATRALLTGEDRTPAGSSDTDSGRLTMETPAVEHKNDDTCSLTSSQFHLRSESGYLRCNSLYDGTNISIGGVSSHSSSGGSNVGYASSAVVYRHPQSHRETGVSSISRNSDTFSPASIHKSGAFLASGNGTDMAYSPKRNGGTIPSPLTSIVSFFYLEHS